MVSPKELRKAIYGRLNVSSVTSLLAEGSASLFHDVARANAIFPFVVFNEVSEVDVNQTFGGGQQESRLWQVKAVDHNTTASVAEDIDAACAERLHYAPLTVTGGIVLYLTRESGVAYAETDGDEQYRHKGGLYRVVTGSL